MSKEQNNFDKSATTVKERVTALTKTVNSRSFLDFSDPKDIVIVQRGILEDLKTGIRQLDAIRVGNKQEAPVDMNFRQFMHEKWGFSNDLVGVESFIRALGKDLANNTLESFMTAGDFNEGFRWLVPELVREAIRLGMVTEPIYKQLIAAEESISQPKLQMPFVNRADAMVSKLGEGATIPTGTISFGQKDVSTQKMGVGIKLTDEVIRYVAINVLALFFQDMGVKLNMGLDNMAIDTLINGDGNANAAAVVGVTTPGTLAYEDMLRAWIRLGMIGRQPQLILTNEEMAIEALQIPQFNQRDTYIAGMDNRVLNLRTPIPRVQDLWISGAMPINNQIMFVDRSKALLKFNSMPLRLENERIAEKQISGTYATLETGFAILFQDGRLIMDKSLAMSANGFPAYMDYAAYQKAQLIRN